MKNTCSAAFVFMVIIALLLPTCVLMAKERATFVIVHGAWGGSWSFKQTDSILTARGHQVYRPSLTGQGERVHLSSPGIDLNTHVLDVVNTLLFEELTDVILVGHSYGGMVITGVADSIPERIGKLVYLDAFVPNDGESVMTVRGDGELGPEGESTDGFVVPRWVKDTDPLPRDVPQALKTFTTPVSFTNPLAKSLPASYILTVEEGGKPEEDGFAFFAERARQRGWKVMVMTADHNPQWSKVTELVNMFEEEIFSHADLNNASPNRVMRKQ